MCSQPQGREPRAKSHAYVVCRFLFSVTVQALLHCGTCTCTCTCTTCTCTCVHVCTCNMCMSCACACACACENLVTIMCFQCWPKGNVRMLVLRLSTFFQRWHWLGRACPVLSTPCLYMDRARARKAANGGRLELVDVRTGRSGGRVRVARSALSKRTRTLLPHRAVLSGCAAGGK